MDIARSLWKDVEIKGREGDMINAINWKKSLVICWQIWTYRNKVIHNNHTPNIKQLKGWIQRYFTELKLEERSNLKDAPHQVLNVPILPTKWIPIPAELWKLNCDASWSESRSQGDIGWIIRHSNVSPVTASYKSIDKKWSISWLEAFAVCEGLRAIPLNSPKWE